jgi:hypothetical protein
LKKTIADFKFTTEQQPGNYRDKHERLDQNISGVCENKRHCITSGNISKLRGHHDIFAGKDTSLCDELDPICQASLSDMAHNLLKVIRRSLDTSAGVGHLSVVVLSFYEGPTVFTFLSKQLSNQNIPCFQSTGKHCFSILLIIYKFYSL